jgi:hypothetical protein
MDADDAGEGRVGLVRGAEVDGLAGGRDPGQEAGGGAAGVRLRRGVRRGALDEVEDAGEGVLVEVTPLQPEHLGGDLGVEGLEGEEGFRVALRGEEPVGVSEHADPDELGAIHGEAC